MQTCNNANTNQNNVETALLLWDRNLYKKLKRRIYSKEDYQR